MNKFTSREFLIALLALFSLFVLVWHGKISSETYGMCFIGTVGSYIGARSWQKIKGKETDKGV